MKIGGIALQLANNCVYESWDGATLVLSLDPLHKHLQAGRAEQRLGEALEACMRQRLQLKITAGSVDAVTPAKSRAIAAADRQQEAEKSMAEDPLVVAMKERMEARLIPGTVRPVDE